MAGLACQFSSAFWSKSYKLIQLLVHCYIYVGSGRPNLEFWSNSCHYLYCCLPVGNELEETEGGLCADNEDSEHLKRPFLFMCVWVLAYVLVELTLQKLTPARRLLAKNPLGNHTLPKQKFWAQVLLRCLATQYHIWMMMLCNNTNTSGGNNTGGSNNTNTSGGGTLDNRISAEWAKQLVGDAAIMQIMKRKTQIQIQAQIQIQI